MSVAVLGCGPSGLAAALAAIRSGHEVLIASNVLAPSTQYGCQYLHAPIPGYEDVAHAQVGYHLCGTAEEYRVKVYGKKWMGRVSPEDFIGEHDAWDIRETYNRLWRDLHTFRGVRFLKVPRVKNGLMPEEIYRYKPGVIISTIPATELCYGKDHEFVGHRIYANGTVKQGTDDVNTIVCDGTRNVEWYRNACVFGYRTIEWSKRPKNGDVTVTVNKPLSTNCSCYPEIRRIGRYGKWQKSYLVHQAYPEVMEFLDGVSLCRHNGRGSSETQNSLLHFSSVVAEASRS